MNIVNFFAPSRREFEMYASFKRDRGVILSKMLPSGYGCTASVGVTNCTLTDALRRPLCVGQFIGDLPFFVFLPNIKMEERCPSKNGHFRQKYLRDLRIMRAVIFVQCNLCRWGFHDILATSFMHKKIPFSTNHVPQPQSARIAFMPSLFRRNFYVSNAFVQISVFYYKFVLGVMSKHRTVNSKILRVYVY